MLRHDLVNLLGENAVRRWHLRDLLKQILQTSFTLAGVAGLTLELGGALFESLLFEVTEHVARFLVSHD
ncbi:hypothetical protein [Microbacterium mitrae]|uniref:hypothetical protein n=1 Tax=Microbacterium mitrae TaxID=664640 RepID=UPI00319DC1F1